MVNGAIDHLKAGKSRYWDLLRNDFHSLWETTYRPTGIYLAENPHLEKRMAGRYLRTYSVV